jgi:hypothetical protein
MSCPDSTPSKHTPNQRLGAETSRSDDRNWSTNRLTLSADGTFHLGRSHRGSSGSGPWPPRP